MRAAIYARVSTERQERQQTIASRNCSSLSGIGIVIGVGTSALWWA